MDVLSGTNIALSDSALETTNGRFSAIGQESESKLYDTPFFRPIVPVERSPIGVAFGILWNGGVVRVNVATLKGVAFGISRTITKRLDLMSGSSLGFRLRPHNRRDPKPRRDCQNGTKKENVRAGAIGRKKGVLPLDWLHWTQGAHPPPPSPAAPYWQLAGTQCLRLRSVGLGRCYGQGLRNQVQDWQLYRTDDCFMSFRRTAIRDDVRLFYVPK